MFYSPFHAVRRMNRFERDKRSGSVHLMLFATQIPIESMLLHCCFTATIKTKMTSTAQQLNYINKFSYNLLGFYSRLLARSFYCQRLNLYVCMFAAFSLLLLIMSLVFFCYLCYYALYLFITPVVWSVCGSG